MVLSVRICSGGPGSQALQLRHTLPHRGTESRKRLPDSRNLITGINLEIEYPKRIATFPNDDMRLSVK
jgi:hypothetical protein